MARLRRINPILPEFLGNLLLFGVFVQAVGIWLVKDKLAYTTGLWIGIALAMGSAIHMSVLILDAVDAQIVKKAKHKTSLFSILRFFIIASVFFAVAYFQIGDVLLMLIGLMGLKAAAYLYPLTQKISVHSMKMMKRR
jgi:hypothetical protein